jgi:hypothetical protein
MLHSVVAALSSHPARPSGAAFALRRPDVLSPLSLWPRCGRIIADDKGIPSPAILWPLGRGYAELRVYGVLRSSAGIEFS